MRRQSSTDRLGRLATLVIVTLVFIVPISIVSRAGTFMFPVQSEQAITGTTTGLGGAQTDDGVLETLRESDTAPDSVTAPATQTLTTGTIVSGTFPAGIASEDTTFVQYREALPSSTTYYPSSQTITTGAACGGTFPTSLDTADDAYLCLREANTGGALAFDAASSTSIASGSTLSWSHTTSGTNRLLVVGVSWKSTSVTVSTVTYGGQALLSIGSQTDPADYNIHMFHLVNPPTGPNTVSVTLSGSVGNGVVGGSISFSGVDQTTPLGTFASAGGASSTATVNVASAVNELVVDTLAAEATLTAGVGQTEQWNLHSGQTDGGGSTKPGAASVTMSWSLSSSRDWAIGAVSVRPSGVGTNYQTSARHDWSGIATGGDAYDLCVEAFVTSAAGESALVQVLTPPGTWNTRITVSKTADDNADQCYTLTTTEFNAGAPSIRWIGSTEIGDSTQSDMNIDHERIIRRFTNDRLDVRYDWTGVPSGASYVLSVKGYRSDEDVNVQVLTPPGTWNTRLTVNSITSTLVTYTLIPSEYNGGSPQVRFLDVAAADPSASDMFLDWVAVTTIRLTYSLEVRQNVTGIITGSNPILVVKGNISAGGENFHVHVWNFMSSAWDLLLSAPFAATNAYHNSSLAADHLSGGTVRVRFVDGASQDSTRWALSLDFVAVAITNEQAVLTNAGVSPGSGSITTNFTFFVRYSDSENNAPAFVNLTLDGIADAMVENNSADTNYVDGKDYFLNRVIGIRGTFDYFFSARASAGDLTLAATPLRQVSVLNRAPSISNSITSDTVHAGQSYMHDFNGSDPDGDTLIWSISTNASWLSIGSANGTAWGVAPPDIRSFYANLSVSDGFGGFDFRNFSLAVVNRPPTIFVSAPSTVQAGASYSGSFSGTDPDDDPLSWSLMTNATWLFIDAATGQLYGTPSPGTFFANLSGRDPYGGAAFQNFTISVQGPSTTPPPDIPPWLQSAWWTFSLTFLLFGVLIAIVIPRRRPIIESAFLIDRTGRVRLEFAIPGTAYDEGRLQSTLKGVSWKGLDRLSDPPYTLHTKPDPSGDWIFVSRTSDGDRVMKSAGKLISKMQGDVTSRKKPRLSERPS